MSKKTYREVLSWASSFLEKHGKESHAILYVFLARKDWTQTQWLINMDQEISNQEQEQITLDLKFLLKDYPPQYITGFEEFYGQRFQVTEATLIPRPETEELVACCLQETIMQKDQPLKVVDVGTGTGVIAITLKQQRPDWQLSAVDISAKALSVAKKNALAAQTQIDFYLGNTLEPIHYKIDLLISNPPYISSREWNKMDPSVRKYEPEVALFAEHDGLAIYQKLAQEAKDKLNGKGKIFMEMGYQQKKAVKEIYQLNFPDKKVEIRKDMAGKDRFLFVH
ncbi:MAG TPA: peptide chain release factor N(5)-glutamine methyltransferase [Tetragenococcus sp.]|nr:peptide chain release factor N(5)-glutamine methyltransferase [Tetragenococcus sp.]